MIIFLQVATEGFKPKIWTKAHCLLDKITAAFLDFVQSAKLIIHWLKPEKMVQRSLLKQPALTKNVRKNRHGTASPCCPTQRYQPGTFSFVWALCFREDQPPNCFKCFATWDLVVCLSTHSSNIKGQVLSHLYFMIIPQFYWFWALFKFFI